MGLTTGWERDVPVEDTLLRRFVYAWADRGRTFAEARGGRHRRTDDADFADTVSTVLFDNTVTLLRPLDGAALAAVVEEAVEFFPPERPWALLSVWPTPDLTGTGMEPVGHPPFMVRMPAPPGAAGDHGLRIVEARTDEELAAFRQVLVDGYPLPPGGAVGDPRTLGRATTFWLAYDGSDRPVAVSSATVDHGIVDVEWIAVLPSERGKGYGKAMTMQAALTAPGLPAVLLASDDGRPVYERLGFVSILRCTIWSRPSLHP